MRKILVASALLVFAGAVYVGLANAQLSDNAAVPILTWESMVPVSGPYKGTSNPIRGITGGALAWMISGASGTLHSNGALKVRTRGLVFAEGPNTGTNPFPFLRAEVSCLSIGGSGQATTVNQLTDAFPADSMGNVTINTKLTLPKPCLAPIVFVTSDTGVWFVATGK
ncbi:MAG: hypothetical protein M1404_07820 [Acidobacteria bacterium]|nr:hypothetical protein [Acidobacteriota bacterium]